MFMKEDTKLLIMVIVIALVGIIAVAFMNMGAKGSLV